VPAVQVPTLTGWAGDPFATIPPLVAAWVAHLDVDLDLAQRILRLPAAELPPVPAAGEPVDLEPPRPVAPPPRLGAYARRARKAGSA
jgi:hypothetical protein